MRKFLEIDLNRQKVSKRQLAGRELAEAGRYLIARTLVERNVAQWTHLPRTILSFSQLGHSLEQISPMRTVCLSAVKAR